MHPNQEMTLQEFIKKAVSNAFQHGGTLELDIAVMPCHGEIIVISRDTPNASRIKFSVSIEKDENKKL